MDLSLRVDVRTMCPHEGYSSGAHVLYACTFFSTVVETYALFLGGGKLLGVREFVETQHKARFFGGGVNYLELVWDFSVVKPFLKLVVSLL